VRILLAGATGVIGRPLAKRLLADGHQVAGTTRTAARAADLEALGMTVAQVDALDGAALRTAIGSVRPEVIINQLTALPQSFGNPREGARAAALTNRLRTEASATIRDAAAEVGVRRIVSQSIAFAQRPGSQVRTEDDPLYVDAPSSHGAIVRAVADLERATTSTDVPGVVLRYGAIYGPGTYFAPAGGYVEMLEKRRLPIVGKGRGMQTHIHIDDCVEATVRALDMAPGVYNVVDEHPVAAAEWIPYLGALAEARPPRRLPAFLFSIGPLTVLRYLIDQQPPVTAARFRAATGWSPAYPDWRSGFTDLFARSSG